MCTQLSATQDRLPSVHAANLDDLQQHTTTQFMTQTHNNAVHDTDAQQHSSWHIRTTTQFNGPDHQHSSWHIRTTTQFNGPDHQHSSWHIRTTTQFMAQTHTNTVHGTYAQQRSSMALITPRICSKGARSGWRRTKPSASCSPTSCKNTRESPNSVFTASPFFAALFTAEVEIQDGGLRGWRRKLRAFCVDIADSTAVTAESCVGLQECTLQLAGQN